MVTTRFRTVSLALSAAVLSALTCPACKSPVGVRETGFAPVYQEFQQNVLDEQELSAGSQDVLESYGLERLYRDDAEQAVAELTEISLTEGLRALHANIAEMHYDIALRSGDRTRFMSSVVHAYMYLFGEGFAEEPNAYSQSFRTACDLYNRGLAQALRKDSGEVLIGGVDVETPTGSLTIRCDRSGFPWDEEEFSTFLPADVYEVRGLRERARAHGLGMPLIAVHSGTGREALTAQHVGREVELAATAFLRFHGGLEELAAGEMTATLELYESTDTRTVKMGERQVPLEVDLTAPLAYMLEDSSYWSFGIRGFRKGVTDDEAGVFMLQPYEKGKIPLVLIHGTASSPAAWAQTINGILADHRLVSRYQVWLAMYNTGNPISYSASVVRGALNGMVADLDPDGKDAAMSRMVLVGHSQGGLVARLLVTASGEDVWRLITDIPFDEYPLSGSDREIIRRSIFFEPVPFVQRVVFISTPHRGSFFARTWVGGLAKGLIALPFELANTAESALKRRNYPPELRKIPTSVDNMRPGSNFIETLGSLPFSNDLHLHSVVAVKKGWMTIEKGDDGVVAYTSAHLDEAESELIVRDSHSCQGSPEVVVELRRVLFEHIGVERSEIEE
jgi:pimeloyl-ACP methyl ester carboxylesterase